MSEIGLELAEKTAKTPNFLDPQKQLFLCSHMSFQLERIMVVRDRSPSWFENVPAFEENMLMPRSWRYGFRDPISLERLADRPHIRAPTNYL